MTRKLVSWKTAIVVGAALAIFSAGVVVGANKFEQPSSILHVVAISWTPESTPEQRQAAIQGVEKMAAAIPGIKRIWLKSTRAQGFNHALAIEFEDRAAADRYAKHPAHEEWYKVYTPVRAESRSFQITN